MYGIDLSVQIENLMPSLGLGFLLGFIYDAVRFLRLAFSKGKTVLFITDMLFIVFCTLTSYLMILGVNNGNIRIYLILAEITGAAVYFCTAGIVISAILRSTADIIRKIFQIIITPFVFLKKRIMHLIKTMSEKMYIFLKKFQNKFKKPLQDEDEMLYNNNN